MRINIDIKVFLMYNISKINQIEIYGGRHMKQWIIAICVAIVYLAISFIFDVWAYSWIIWVVYSLYRLSDNIINSRNKL